MMELIIYVMLALLAASPLLLRKVNVGSTSLTNNAASFVNQTADRLHIRKVVGRVVNTTTASTIGDSATSSLDEVPVAQNIVNDSRSHIAQIQGKAPGGTGSAEPVADNVMLTFERGQLFLDPDEALFVNNTDVSGAMAAVFMWNLWYED